MRPCDVYAKELSTLTRGHAILDPRRDKLQSGGLRPAINVGDVAYDLDGKLIRLFNCLVPPDQQDADCIFPEDFQVLEMVDTSDIARSTPIIVKESYSRPSPFYSKGVRILQVEVEMNASSAAGARIAFTTRHEQGAVLVTSGRVRTRKSPNRPAFERYMVKHYDSWCSLLRSYDLDVRPDEVMLITAVDMTQSWSNLAFRDRQLQGEFSVDVPSVYPVNGRVGASMSFSTIRSVTRDSGPNPEDMEVEHGTESVYVSSLSPDSAQEDQVIFVRALRGKKRKFMGIKISASADPKDLDGSPSDDGHSAVSIEGIGGIEPREDYLTAVLDLMLENPNVELAIIHDDDYNDHLRRMESSPTTATSLLRSQIIDGVICGKLDTGFATQDDRSSSLWEDGVNNPSQAGPEPTCLKEALEMNHERELFGSPPPRQSSPGLNQDPQSIPCQIMTPGSSVTQSLKPSGSSFRTNHRHDFPRVPMTPNAADDKATSKGMTPNKTVKEWGRPVRKIKSSSGEPKKRLSPFNKFMKKELTRMKEEKPDMTHKERFTLATQNWKTAKDNAERAST